MDNKLTETRSNHSRNRTVAATTDVLLRELASLSEAELQSHVIEPLLKLKGFRNVRVTSGSNEKGKDLIATKTDDFGKNILVAIQIKKTKLTGKISSPNSLGAVLNQLRQAMSEPAIDPITGNRRRAQRLLFFTPYPLTNNVIESVQEQFAESQQRGLTIIDGNVLVEEILEHMPDAILKLSMEAQYRGNIIQASGIINESTQAYNLAESLNIDNLYVQTSITESDLGVLVPADYIKSSEKLDNINVSKDCLNDLMTMLRIHNATNLCEIASQGRGRKITISINIKKIMSLIHNDVSELMRSLTSLEKNTAIRHQGGAEIRQMISNLSSIRRLSGHEEFQEIAYDHATHNARRNEPKGSRVPISVLSKIDAPIFVRGAPGAGKTTLLRRLVQTQSRQTNSKQLPILVYLARILGNPSKEAILQACLSELEDHGYQPRSEDNDKYLHKKLINGAFRIYLDGLDELGARASVALDAVRELASIYPKTNIVLSCRESFNADWYDALTLRLAPFSSGQLDQFINNWFTAQPSSYDALSSWIQENKNIAQIASTPLIAGLLCSLFEAEADLPTTEAELYACRFDLLLGKWDSAKRVNSLPRHARRKYLLFLRDIACELHTKDRRVISNESAIKKAEQYKLETYHKKAESLLNDCVQRGLLVNESLGGLSFGHFTYQEYLVADWLANENDVPFVLGKLGISWWEKVLEFYAAIRGDISRLIDLSTASGSISELELRSLNKLIKFAPNTSKRALEKLRNTMSFDDWRVS